MSMLCNIKVGHQIGCPSPFTHIPHLVASGGQGGDEALPLVIVHPGQCLALLAHHAEVDLGIRKNI